MQEAGKHPRPGSESDARKAPCRGFRTGGLLGQETVSSSLQVQWAEAEGQRSEVLVGDVFAEWVHESARSRVPVEA